ncbi:Uncharacterised protein [Mycobacteroides abscessus subsp. abscessus]|nr:Uncharacterised protein [Mycobacteroides abscessus subsp. abscessus]
MRGAQPTTEPLRYRQVSAEARILLNSEGESGRFEFKQTAKAVRPEVLCAAANWVALQRGEVTDVTLLVGIEEVKDSETGLVTGRVLGVSDLERAVETIQHSVRETRPVPVSVTIIEEGVGTPKPFLRLKIRPTFAPHFDAEGRRQTRNNASTRPLTDEELLDIYLDREAAKFEQRFSQTADRVTSQLGDIEFAIEHTTGELSEISNGVDQLSENFGQVHETAWKAADEAEESRSVAERLESALEDLERHLLGQHDDSPPGLFFRLMDTRWGVWEAFSENAAYRPTRTTDQLASRLKKLLETPLQPDAWFRNMSEIDFWRDVLRRRDLNWTMTAWSREIARAENASYDPGHPIMDDNRIDHYRAFRETIRGTKPRPKSVRRKR